MGRRIGHEYKEEEEEEEEVVVGGGGEGGSNLVGLKFQLFFLYIYNRYKQRHDFVLC